MKARWDLFICHASEDKANFVSPLVAALRQKRPGIKIWYDELLLKIGDSLRRSLDHGLASSRYGVVVISPAFFRKKWPQWELDGLAAREEVTRKVILPIWHELDREEVLKHSPLLADRVAARSSDGIDLVAHRILEVLDGGGAVSTPLPQRSRRRLALASVAILICLGLVALGALRRHWNSGGIEGLVQFAAMNSPVSGVSVTAEKGGKRWTRTTDARGHFAIERLNVGTYAVRVSGPEIVTAVDSTRVVAGATPFLQLRTYPIPPSDGIWAYSPVFSAPIEVSAPERKKYLNDSGEASVDIDDNLHAPGAWARIYEAVPVEEQDKQTIVLPRDGLIAIKNILIHDFVRLSEEWGTVTGPGYVTLGYRKIRYEQSRIAGYILEATQQDVNTFDGVTIGGLRFFPAYKLASGYYFFTTEVGSYRDISTLPLDEYSRPLAGFAVRIM